MSKYFLADIFGSIDMQHDFVKGWIPLLEHPETFDEDTRQKLSELGARAVGVVGMAAVEQYATKNLLKKGTTDLFRRRAFYSYREAVEQIAFQAGQIYALELFLEQNEFHAAWVEMQLHDVRNRKNEIWQETAKRSLQILKDIQGQQFRKKHKGRLEVFGGIGTKPAHDMRNLIDAEILNMAVAALAPSLKNDLEAIKKAAREIVKEFVARDTLRAGHLTIAEAVDSNCKRINRKIEVLHKAATRAAK